MTTLTSTKQITSIGKLLSDETRVNILTLLLESTADLCVMEISDAIAMSHSATSHQLSKLENAGVVSSFRDGQTVCYHLTDKQVTVSIRNIINNL